jgi:hypothetical protein
VEVTPTRGEEECDFRKEESGGEQNDVESVEFLGTKSIGRILSK